MAFIYIMEPYWVLCRWKVHVIALYGEEFDVFPESFGGWEFFFFFFYDITFFLFSVSRNRIFFFFSKSKARPQKCSALGHSSTRLCCQHCQTWDRNQPRACGTKVYSGSHLEGEFSALSLNKAHNRHIFARTWKSDIKLTTSRPSPFYFSIHVIKWK